MTSESLTKTTIDALTPAPIEITSTVSTTTNNEKDPHEFNNDIKIKLEKTIESLNEKILHLNGNLNEMTNLYETAKQNELDEKTKIKHSERSLRAIKIEKDQLFAQIVDLQERVNLQAKDLQEAQTQRKLAVQEFTDVNDKVKELRSKNVKLSNDLLNKEDEIEELKRLCATHKFDLEKRDKTIDDFKLQIVNYKENLSKLEAERQEFLQQNLILKTNESSTDEETSKCVESKDESKEILVQQLQAQLNELETRNSNILNELESTKQTHLEASQKIHDELARTVQSKDNEIKLAQDEIARLNLDIEQLNNNIAKLQQEKKGLEDEVNLFNESKQAMSKYDWQMNEILQMVNEEKVVRGHLRSLASKLIEEVDSLRSQTAAAASTGVGVSSLMVSNGMNTSNLSNNNMLNSNGANGMNGWKNRCSEKRERINVQNMQIALEKEFEAKGQLLDENNILKSEMESRAHKIVDLQSIIGTVVFFNCF